MARRVKNRVFVAFRPINNGKSIAFDLQLNAEIEFSRVAFFAVGAYHRQNYAVFKRLYVVKLFIEASYAAVKLVFALVRRQNALFTVEKKSCVFYAVCVPPYGCAQVGVRRKIVGDFIESECNIASLKLYIIYNRAERKNAERKIAARNFINIDFPTVVQIEFSFRHHISLCTRADFSFANSMTKRTYRQGLIPLANRVHS